MAPVANQGRWRAAWSLSGGGLDAQAEARPQEKEAAARPWGAMTGKQRSTTVPSAGSQCRFATNQQGTVAKDKAWRWTALGVSPGCSLEHVAVGRPSTPPGRERA